MIVALRREHIEQINRSFSEQGWATREEVLERYVAEQENGERLALVYEEDGRRKGYITLIIEPSAGPFGQLGVPEISDFNVFERYRRNGIGQKLLDSIIDLSRRYSDSVGICVGLHSGYGQAQRMYVKNGFTPDGNGVYYAGKTLAPYANCVNDDELTLCFIKKTSVSC